MKEIRYHREGLYYTEGTMERMVRGKKEIVSEWVCEDILQLLGFTKLKIPETFFDKTSEIMRASGIYEDHLSIVVQLYLSSIQKK